VPDFELVTRQIIRDVADREEAKALVRWTLEGKDEDLGLFLGEATIEWNEIAP